MDLDIFQVIDQNVTVHDSQVDNYVVTTSYILTTVPIILLLFGIPANCTLIPWFSKLILNSLHCSVLLFSTWCCPSVIHMVLHCCSRHGAVPLYSTWCCTGVLHMVLYRCSPHGAVPLFSTWCCTAVLHMLLYRCPPPGAVPLFSTWCCRCSPHGAVPLFSTWCCTVVLHIVLYRCPPYGAVPLSPTHWSPGNLLCIAVLSRRSMKDNVFSVYLVSLCVFNILTMCVNLPRFINYGEVGREFSFHNDYVCMLYRWLTITLIVITNWHLVIITAARLTFVLDRKRKIHVYRYNPLQYIFIICLVVIMVELPIVVFWVRIVTDKNGNVECYLPGTSWLVYVQMSLQGFLPAILLIGLNTWIFYQHKVRDSGMISSRHSSKMVRHLAVLSVLSSLQFVLTTIPMTILYPGRKRLFDLSTPVGQSKGNLAFSLALMSIHFNYSSNFLIYCFFGRRFRSEFFKLIQDSLRPLCILDFMDVMDYVSSSSASEVSKMKTEVSSSAASNAPDSYKSENDPAQLEPDRLRANSAGKKSTSSERTYQSARGDTSASIAVTEASIYADVITYFSDGSQKSVEEDHELKGETNPKAEYRRGIPELSLLAHSR
ncbi:hypothetical protein Btru_071557 [Bulinus truncatus]|nr:hypothetical protein Btru_071557 [Bulinus truncatus]